MVKHWPEIEANQAAGRWRTEEEIYQGLPQIRELLNKQPLIPPYHPSLSLGQPGPFTHMQMLGLNVAQSVLLTEEQRRVEEEYAISIQEEKKWEKIVEEAKKVERKRVRLENRMKKQEAERVKKEKKAAREEKERLDQLAKAGRREERRKIKEAKEAATLAKNSNPTTSTLRSSSNIITKGNDTGIDGSLGYDVPGVQTTVNDSSMMVATGNNTGIYGSLGYDEMGIQPMVNDTFTMMATNDDFENDGLAELDAPSGEAIEVYTYLDPFSAVAEF